MKSSSKFRRFMWLAALISLAALLLLQALHAALGGGLLDALRITALTCLYHFAVRLLIGEALIPRIDFAGIDCENRWFRARAWEPALYARLGVRRWKGGAPTYDPSEFDLRAQGIDGLIRSTCRAELTHELNALASFVPLQFAQRFGALPAFLLTSALAALADLAFVAIQRYNRPRLLRLRRMRTEGRRSGERP